MKRNFILILFLAICAVACSPKPESETYDGKLLTIAYVGEKPAYESSKISYKEVPVEGIQSAAEDLSADFDALFVMPGTFEKLSTDSYTPFFHGLSIPVAFVGSEKGHLPFITEGVTYQTGFDLGNGSHSTVYMNTGGAEKREDAWYFYLEDADGHPRSPDEVFSDMLRKIEEL
ncbi:hypothetical protein ACFFIY_09060 [Bhargavaea ullalensis]|uniref:Lipoprotein n=1 Tax=Bhargavaea ullalensis TaxID=1265685 RepID=A0ABV2GDY6_9BACL